MTQRNKYSGNCRFLERMFFISKGLENYNNTTLTICHGKNNLEKGRSSGAMK
jgi:hypothetical protein